MWCLIMGYGEADFEHIKQIREVIIQQIRNMLLDIGKSGLYDNEVIPTEGDLIQGQRGYVAFVLAPMKAVDGSVVEYALWFYRSKEKKIPDNPFLKAVPIAILHVIQKQGSGMTIEIPRGVLWLFDYFGNGDYEGAFETLTNALSRVHNKFFSKLSRLYAAMTLHDGIEISTPEHSA